LIVYQIYLRSYAAGGLRGVRERLPRLGVDALWLSPVHPSPNVDWGYDVADYYDVHRDYGTLEDVDALVAEAHAKSIDVWLDLVPNHTSDKHPWFTDHPEYYVWSDHVPNDWRSIFTGGSGWSYDSTRKRYFLHQFAPQQPDLDWWNPDVRDEFDRILGFWFDRGIRGLRIDVAHGIIKDRELRDGGDTYMRNRPEVHDVFARWQHVAAAYDPKPILMGETYVSLEQLAPYWQHLDLVQNFPFLRAEFTADDLRPIVERTMAMLPSNRRAVWFGSNHDHSRMATRWAQGDEAKHKAALFLILTLPGVALLYQGDEIGLEDGVVPRDRILDLATPSRDPERTPMPWTRSGKEWVDPWLPLTNTKRNVADQEVDPDSILNYTRRLVQERKQLDDRSYRTLKSPKGVWAYARGPRRCVLNMTDDVAGYEGTVLQPWEGRLLD
jgi:alpha-glucosidase